MGRGGELMESSLEITPGELKRPKKTNGGQKNFKNLRKKLKIMKSKIGNKDKVMELEIGGIISNTNFEIESCVFTTTTNC